MSDNSKKLTVEILPRTQYFQFLHTEVYEQQWNYIASLCYHRASGVCEYCGSEEGLVYHTAWKYNVETKLATVAGVELMCGKCYQAKSIDNLFIKPKAHDDLINHLIKVNDMSFNNAKNEVAQAYKACIERSKVLWVMDVLKQKSWLDEKSPVSGFEQMESEIEQLKGKFIDRLADGEDAGRLALLFDNYPRYGFREQNLVVQKEHLSQCLRELQVRFKDRAGLSLMEVMGVVLPFG